MNITHSRILRQFCYSLYMKRLLPALIVVSFSLGYADVTNGADQMVNSCSEKDRDYAKFWRNYYDPEGARNFGLKIKRLVKDRNLEALFGLVDGELTSGPRKNFIKGKKFN